MKHETKVPSKVATYDCHGLHMAEVPGGQWEGDCPYCEKDGHFFVDEKTGQFDCKVCGECGNQITFMTDFAKAVAEATDRKKLLELAVSRGTTEVGGTKFFQQMPIPVLRKFGVGWNPLRKSWLIPCVSDKGTVRDIRRYRNGTVMSTAGASAYLGGVDELLKPNNKRRRVWLCEGEWDAMAVWWMLKEAKRIRDNCVCWVPGASTFKDEWVGLFKGRNVLVCYDHDEAGARGAEKVYKKLGTTAGSMHFVEWPDVFDNGFDARDFVISSLHEGKDAADILNEMATELAVEVPKRVVANGTEVIVGDAAAVHTVDDDVAPISFDELIRVCKRHILMNDEMVVAMWVTLAVCLSNDLAGDPLWLYLIGPPGAGKTLLLSALQESARCYFVSTLTPHSLVSGWRGDGASDPSLLPKLRNKTFIAKDFTELLTMPSMVQDELFSTLRGAYDGYVQRPFGNGVVREYKDCFFSFVAGVTNAIHGSSKASLGERFLKFQLNPPEEAMADDIVMMAIKNVGRERAMEAELQTAGKAFLANRIDPANTPVMPEQYVRRLIALVHLIAVLRAQVERDFRGEEISYMPVPEAGTRLAKQLTKLAICLCAVDGLTEVDERVFTVIEKIAMDTANKLHLAIVEAMMLAGGALTKREVGDATSLPTTTLSRRIDDLVVLGAVKACKDRRMSGGRPSLVYEVTTSVAKLWCAAKEAKEASCQTRKSRSTKRSQQRRHSRKSAAVQSNSR